MEKVKENIVRLDIKNDGIKKKLTNKQDNIDKLFKPNNNGMSEWVEKDNIDKVDILKWGNNGVFRHGVFQNDNRYLWEKLPKKGKIQKIRTVGKNYDYLCGHERPIRNDIRKFYESKPCVACGETNSIIIDHKNDLYNDERVLNKVSQTLEDFQSLCNSCNLKKRQICKRTKETGERYGATNIPSLAVFGIDFIEGGKEFSLNDKNAMIGTYWYDPLRFMNYIKMTLSSP
jgi:5-methylcytosine-specific restriction endonuclease McrA